MIEYITMDHETRSARNLLKTGPWPYSECVTTEMLCTCFKNHLGQRERWWPGLPVPKMLVQAVLGGWYVIAHNVAFEKAMLRNHLVPIYGWPDVPNHLWHDTAAVCAMKGIPHSLGPACIVMRLAAQKDEEESSYTVSLSKCDKKGWLPPITPEVRERVLQYCDSDVEAEDALHDRMGWLPYEERRVWLLDQRMNERGVRIDLPLVRQAQKILDGASAPLLKEFHEITGIAKIGSQKLKPWLHARGIMVPDLTAETLVETLGDDEDDATVITDDYRSNPTMRALRIKQLIGSASVKKLPAMIRTACEDGRARGLFKWHGTGPGRGAGQLLQAQNFPRGTLEHDAFDKDGKPIKVKPPIDLLVQALMTGDYEFVEMVIGPAYETVITSLRHMIMADPGKVFISGDYAGIQARVVLALAGQHDKAQLMADGLDVYCDMASAIYGHLVDKKLHPEKRHSGKNTVLGAGFQMGAETFHRKYCKKQPFEFAKKQIDTYRKVWAPEVPKLWYGLQEAATRTVWDGTPHEFRGIEYRLEDGWLTARSPAGSKIWYRDPQKTTRAMPWDPTIVKPGFSFAAWKNKHWIRVHAFGGQLTENMVMRIEVDIKNAGMCNLEDNGFPIVLDVHDELVAELANPDEKAFAQCMLDLPAWIKSYNIPVAIDKPWVNGRYKK